MYPPPQTDIRVGDYKESIEISFLWESGYLMLFQTKERFLVNLVIYNHYLPSVCHICANNKYVQISVKYTNYYISSIGKVCKYMTYELAAINNVTRNAVHSRQ